MIPALFDLQQELYRLCMAGSRFAHNDPRLKKMLPVYQKLGEKAPVFAQLHANLLSLVEGDAQQAPGHLMNTLMLLQAVSVTQADAQPQEDMHPFSAPLLPKDQQIPTTFLPYSQLSPIIHALCKREAGRYRILEEAYEKDMFRDHRLHPFVAGALNDSYSEIVILAGEKILPSIGNSMIPYLRATLDITGNKLGDKYRMRLLGQLGDPQLDELIAEALQSDQTSTVTLVEVLHLLSRDPNNEDTLLSFCKHRKKDVRQTALASLAKIRSAAGMKASLAALQSADYDSAIFALKQADDPALLRDALQICKQNYDRFLDDRLAIEARKKACQKAQEMLSIFPEKALPECLPFLRDVLCDNSFHQACRALDKTGSLAESFSSSLIDILRSTAYIQPQTGHAPNIDLMKELSALPTVRKRYPDIPASCLEFAFLFTHDPQAFFEEFSPWFNDIPSAALLYRLNLHEEHVRLLQRVGLPNMPVLDPRWADAMLPLLSQPLNGKYEQQVLIHFFLSVADAKQPSQKKMLKSLMRSASKLSSPPSWLQTVAEQLIQAGEKHAISWLMDAIDNIRRYRYQIHSCFLLLEKENAVALCSRAQAQRLLSIATKLSRTPLINIAQHIAEQVEARDA